MIGNLGKIQAPHPPAPSPTRGEGEGEEEGFIPGAAQRRQSAPHLILINKLLILVASDRN
jgi:hypothetical protein